MPLISGAGLSAAGGTGCALVLGTRYRRRTAEAYTMEQLPALKEAGVPDAGGEGVCVILRGLLGGDTGTRGEVQLKPADQPIIHSDSHGEDSFGFCTDFLVESPEGTLSTPTGSARWPNRTGAGRWSVVGDGELVRVHAHSPEPQKLLDAAEKMGKLARVKVEDMSAQNVRFRDSGSGAGVKVAMLAMSRGAGFDEIFESLGAKLSDLGVVEKPPAGQIASAAEAIRVADVIVLANHKNVLFAAEQAKTLAQCTIHVVPTTSLPQGVAAAMAFDSSEPAKANLEAMTEAARAIKTIDGTIAGATRRFGWHRRWSKARRSCCWTAHCRTAPVARRAPRRACRSSAGARETGNHLRGRRDRGGRIFRRGLRLREQNPKVEVEALIGGQLFTHTLHPWSDPWRR